MTHRIVLIDMDGVLVDFMPAFFKIAEVPYPDPWPAGVDSLDLVTPHDRMRGMYRCASDFWSNLQPLPTNAALLKLFKRVTICTAPMIPNSRVESKWNPVIDVAASSCAGKLRWLIQHMPDVVHSGAFIFTRDKSLLASQEHLLIDDSDENVIRFREAGGKAILFPQPWNAAHEFTSDPVEYIRSQL